MGRLLSASGPLSCSYDAGGIAGTRRRTRSSTRRRPKLKSSPRAISRSCCSWKRGRSSPRKTGTTSFVTRAARHIHGVDQLGVRQSARRHASIRLRLERTARSGASSISRRVRATARLPAVRQRATAKSRCGRCARRVNPRLSRAAPAAPIPAPPHIFAVRIGSSRVRNRQEQLARRKLAE